MKEIVSKEEIILMLKTKKRKLLSCSDCPLHNLKIRNEMSCRQIIIKLCGKNPTSCKEANSLIYNFLGKFNQNKI